MVNVTLCFSAAQALLAAKAGATFISPFVGRLDDIGDGRHGADRRHRADLPQLSRAHDRSAGRLGPPPDPRGRGGQAGRPCRDTAASGHPQLFNHPLTDSGLAAFLADWQKTGKRSCEHLPCLPRGRSLPELRGGRRSRPSCARIRTSWPSTPTSTACWCRRARVHGERLADHMAAMLDAERARARAMEAEVRAAIEAGRAGAGLTVRIRLAVLALMRAPDVLEAVTQEMPGAAGCRDLHAGGGTGTARRPRPAAGRARPARRRRDAPDRPRPRRRGARPADRDAPCCMPRPRRSCVRDALARVPLADGPPMLIAVGAREAAALSGAAIRRRAGLPRPRRRGRAVALGMTGEQARAAWLAWLARGTPREPAYARSLWP